MTDYYDRVSGQLSRPVRWSDTQEQVAGDIGKTLAFARPLELTTAEVCRVGTAQGLASWACHLREISVRCAKASAGYSATSNWPPVHLSADRIEAGNTSPDRRRGWVRPRPTARRLVAGRIASPLGDQLAEHTHESGMGADGPGSDHVQTEFLAEKAGLLVQVVEHLHVIRQESDGVDQDVLDPALPSSP